MDPFNFIHRQMNNMYIMHTHQTLIQYNIKVGGWRRFQLSWVFHIHIMNIIAPEFKLLLWQCWPSSVIVFEPHSAYRSVCSCYEIWGHASRKILKICTAEIESGSSFDRKQWNCKAHVGWLATPSTSWITPFACVFTWKHVCSNQ